LDKRLAPNEWGVSEALKTILRTAPRPVVGAPELPPAGNSVVIAYDGSLQAARSLYAFASTGLAERRQLHVASFQEDAVEAARRGNRAVEFLSARGIRATLYADGADRPAAQILEFSRQVDAGLIVLGAYGKPWVREFFVGSVTSALLAKCPLPLFLYH
jgi:nucleotide-binding universal stress UspA family protein